MKKTIATFSLVVALLAGVGIGTEGAAADPALQSASGFGQLHLGLPFRNFAFSATKELDGTVTEGPSAPPDEITLAFSGLGIPCTYITDPALLDPFLVTIESGQIQVTS